MTDTPSSLAAANSRRHDIALSAARRAITELQADGTAVTFTAVAQASGVARSWLYDNTEMRHLIGRLRGAAPGPRHDERASAASQRSIAETLRLEIARLREENKALRDQVARQLGINRTLPAVRHTDGEDMSSPSSPAPTSGSS
ncbi:MAG: DUF6262 family protein [Acidimicrobiales bacterium]